MSTIAIDFGTTYSTASWINPQTHQAEPIIFPENGSNKMPSVIAFLDGGAIMVGQKPYNQLNAANAKILERMLLSVKQKMKPQSNYQGVSYTDIVAKILEHIVSQAKQAHPDFNPTDVVLTHPVGFDAAKKTLLTDAARKIGLNPVALREEPIAAARYFVSNGRILRNQGALVYDLGGGTFDLAYVKVDNNGQCGIPIIPQGLNKCGGDDIDQALYDFFLEQMPAPSKEKLRNETDQPFLLRCRMWKESISNNPKNEYTFDELIASTMMAVTLKITKDDFFNVVAATIERTINTTMNMVRDIKAHNYPLDKIILVGGSSQIPLIRNRFNEVLPNVTIISAGNEDVAVSVGALIAALHVNTPPTKERYCMFCGLKNTNLLNREHFFCQFCGKENLI